VPALVSIKVLNLISVSSSIAFAALYAGFYDRATELERMGGRMVELAQTSTYERLVSQLVNVDS